MFYHRCAYLPVIKTILTSLKQALFSESQLFLFETVNTQPGFKMRINIHDFIIWQNAIKLILAYSKESII